MGAVTDKEKQLVIKFQTISCKHGVPFSFNAYLDLFIQIVDQKMLLTFLPEILVRKLLSNYFLLSEQKSSEKSMFFNLIAEVHRLYVKSTGKRKVKIK